RQGKPWNDSYYDPLNDTEIIVDVPSPLGPNQQAALACYSLILLLGVPGNAIVLWVTGFRMPPTVNTQWFLQLALADLLCCLSLPLLMVPLAQDQHWPFGPLACKLLLSSLYVTMYCSVLLLVLISLDRWLLVSRPVWCQNWRRPRSVRVLCIGVWLLALLCSTPHFVYIKEHKYGEDKAVCRAFYTAQAAQIVTVLRFLLSFLLPFFVIVLCHWVVYRRATRGLSTGQNQSRGLSTRSNRTRRVIIAVVLGFALCWLPFHLVDLLMLGVEQHSPEMPHWQLAGVLTHCLAYFNSCLNPLLYVCLGRGFKDSVRRSLRGVLSFLSEEPSRQQTQRKSLSYTKSTSDNTCERSFGAGSTGNL
uniref:Complement C5a receptor 1 n=1 Tax=Scleropages formosus TaxID=113540 RepID=A0A8C9TN90_SCLFO